METLMCSSSLYSRRPLNSIDEWPFLVASPPLQPMFQELSEEQACGEYGSRSRWNIGAQPTRVKNMGATREIYKNRWKPVQSSKNTKGTGENW